MDESFAGTSRSVLRENGTDKKSKSDPKQTSKRQTTSLSRQFFQSSNVNKIQSPGSPSPFVSITLHFCIDFTLGIGRTMAAFETMTSTVFDRHASFERNSDCKQKDVVLLATLATKETLVAIWGMVHTKQARR